MLLRHISEGAGASGRMPHLRGDRQQRRLQQPPARRRPRGARHGAGRGHGGRVRHGGGRGRGGRRPALRGRGRERGRARRRRRGRADRGQQRHCRGDGGGRHRGGGRDRRQVPGAHTRPVVECLQDEGGQLSPSARVKLVAPHCRQLWRPGLPGCWSSSARRRRSGHSSLEPASWPEACGGT